MVEDSIATYRDKLGLVYEAEKRAKRVIKTIDEGAKLLKDDWQHVGVSHPAVSFPTDMVGKSPWIDARKWPDADELADVLSSWHEARLRAANAYRRIPEPRRNLVSPPPLFG